MPGCGVSENPREPKTLLPEPPPATDRQRGLAEGLARRGVEGSGRRRTEGRTVSHYYLSCDVITVTHAIQEEWVS